MNVLEMEEVERLVTGNTGRKRLNGGSQKPQSTCDIVAMCASNSNLLAKTIGVVCVVLLSLVFMLAQSGRGETNIVLANVETKVPAPAVSLKVEQQPTPVEKPTFSPTQRQRPTDLPVNPVIEHPLKLDENANNPPENSNNDAFLYSKFATILPLVDHAQPDENAKAALAEKYGKWRFWDGEEVERPMEDYAGKFPNRDIPGDQFPNYAWQADAVYVNHILNDADKLIARTMEAIFEEYGHAKPLPPEGLAARRKMFYWSREDLSVDNAKPPSKYQKRGDRGNGGWTTKKSFDGLVRRLLHAMMTQDTFTVVLGGHSAAKGEGNHFRQSYMMQFHKVMYPIFARLGVKLITRNISQGGLGTIQGGMGSGSIYGDEVDILMWDSGMTEPDPAHVDIFYRQGLLGGNRVPVLWGGPFELLKMLHEEADVDVGEWGTAMDGITEVESLNQAKDIPWAARFLKCKDEVESLCKEEPRFCAKCWINREDGISPERKQRNKPRGQVKWHPGWRPHQLMGRNLAFAILEALRAAINIWTENVMGGPPLDDSFWHVSKYYDDIRRKVKNLDKSLGKCYNNAGFLPTRLCNTPMKARTQYTPRANPAESSLTSVIKPTPDGYVPKNEDLPLYEGPDEHNTCFDIPGDEIDVFDVVIGRRNLYEKPSLQGLEQSSTPKIVPQTVERQVGRELEDTKIVPGKGWEVWEEPPGHCDGTYNATCGRSTNSECAMIGHHDGRGAIVGNEYSGWLVMTLKDLKEGVIILKLHTWHTEDESTVTKGWTSVNNARGRRLGQALVQSSSKGARQINDRMLTRNYDPPELPNGFIFEYAIDGVITTLDKNQFVNKKKKLQRVVETLTILDDTNFTSKAKDVEIAIRLKNSGSTVVFGVSHVYWA